MVAFKDHMIHTACAPFISENVLTVHARYILMKAVREKASGKTKKNMKIPALSRGIVTMPIEYLHSAIFSLLQMIKETIEVAHITPKTKWMIASSRARSITLPKLGRTTPYPMQTIKSMKKEILFRPALSMATVRSFQVKLFRLHQTAAYQAREKVERRTRSDDELVSLRALITHISTHPTIVQVSIVKTEGYHFDNDEADSCRDVMLNGENLAPVFPAQEGPSRPHDCVYTRKDTVEENLRVFGSWKMAFKRILEVNNTCIRCACG